MNRSRKLFRRSAAVVSAALLATTALPMSAMAADSFTGIVKESIGESAAQVSDVWGTVLSRIDKSAGNAQTAVWTITPGDAGKALAGMAALDLSWLKDIKVNQTQKGQDGKVYAQLEATINDGSIAHINYLLDSATSKVYMNIPEVSDGYLMIDFKQAVQTTENAVSYQIGVDTPDEASTVDPQMVNKILENPEEMLPSGDELSTLLTSYGDLIFDNFVDAEPATATITANGVSQDVTVYNGSLSGEGALATINAFLDYAQADETLASVLDKFGTISNQELTQQFKDALAEAKSDTEGATAEDLNLNISADIYKDAEGKTVGKAFAFATEDVANPDFVLQCLTADDGSQVGLEVNAIIDGDSVSFAGTGTSADELNGDYTLSVEGTPVVNVHAENAGLDSGKLAVSIAEQTSAEEDAASPASMLSAFSLVLGYSGMTTNATTGLSLALTSGGADVISINLDTTRIDADSVEIPSVESLGTIYDVTNETDMQSYSSNLNIQAIMDNATAAGVPEAFIAQLTGMVVGETGSAE